MLLFSPPAALKNYAQHQTFLIIMKSEHTQQAAMVGNNFFNADISLLSTLQKRFELWSNKRHQ